MEFKANPKSIEDTLALKRRYVIPRFQREYSWERDELLTMWEDLIENIQFNNSALISNEYFIGSLVLVGDDDDTANIDRAVVDGQQRLTTFTIAFSVLSQIFRKLGEEKLADITHSYIIGEDKDGNEFEKLKTETNKPFFQLRIQQKNIDFNAIPETPEEKRILNAYIFFEEKLSEKSLRKEFELKYPGINEKVTYIDMLRAFRNQILNCKVVYVTVKTFDDAYTIFEVLNAKGKDLTPVDIIKNIIFSVLTQEVPIDYAYEKWQSIKDLVSKESEQEMLTFYRHYWLSKYSFSTSKKLVKDFEKNITKTPDSYKKFIDDLANAAEIYSKVVVPDLNDWKQPEDLSIYTALDSLVIFGTTQVRTFLLALFETRAKDLISHKDYLFVLCSLEKFHLIFTAICSSRPSGLERRYSSYARKLRECVDKVEARKCTKELIGLLNETLPDYSVFEKRLFDIKYSSREVKDKKLVQYILKKLEWYFAGSNELQPLSFTIEHILPESTRTTYSSLLGNLIPLGDKLNNELKDKPFSQKIKRYQQSNYASVKNFLGSINNAKTWGEEEINRRTKEIADILYNKMWV